MASKLFYHDLDLVKVSELLNARIHNITTTDRGTLGGTLSAGNKGLLVYDTDLNAFYVWNGSAWAAVSSTVSGAMTFKGTSAFNATEPVAPATGDYYVFTTAGTNTWEGSTVVEIGDSVVYDGAAWKFIQGNTLDASETVKGVVELATNAETITGSDTARAVTPAGVAAKLSDYKAAKVYFVSSASLTANTPLTVAHNLNLQNRNAFTINVMDSAHSAISVDVDSVDQNNLTVTSAVALTGVGITVIGF
jgi:uncharacterized membrane protein